MYAYAGALQRLERPIEAIELSDIGVTLAKEDFDRDPSMEAKRFLAQVLDSTAKCYDSKKMFDEALKLSEESIPLWREVAAETSSHATDLSNSLGSHAYRLLQLKDQQGNDSSWIFITQAIDLEREIYSFNPSSHRERLAQVLLQYAGYAERFSHPNIVLEAGSEAIDLTRSIFEERGDESTLELFAQRLKSHATFAEKVEAWEVAFVALGEAIPLWRRLDSQGLRQHRLDLVDVLQSHFAAAWNLDRVADALASLAEQLQSMKQLMSWEPGKYDSTFKNNLQIFKAILETVKDEFPQYADADFLAENLE